MARMLSRKERRRERERERKCSVHKKNVQQNLITCPRKFVEVTLGEWEGGVEINWPNLLDLLPRLLFVFRILYLLSLLFLLYFVYIN